MPKELGSRLGPRNALGLAEAGIAIMDSQIILGEGGERERDKRSVERLIQNNMDGREPWSLKGVCHKGFSRSPQKLRGMGYNSDSTSFQDDLRPAMLNPSDMCEVTRVDRTWCGLD